MYCAMVVKTVTNVSSYLQFIYKYFYFSDSRTGSLCLVMAPLWISMPCYGTSMDLYALLWHLYGSLCLVMAPLWISMPCYGTSMDLYALLWHLYGSLCLVMSPLWISMPCYGSTMDLYALLWHLYGSTILFNTKIKKNIKISVFWLIPERCLKLSSITVT